MFNSKTCRCHAQVACERSRMMRIAILGSTRGSSMQPIIDAIKQNELAAEIGIVISNKSDAFILERARQSHLPALFIDPEGLSRADYDTKVITELHKHTIQLVVLIGYMRVLSDEFIAAYRGRIINVHPSLLPAFAG